MKNVGIINGIGLTEWSEKEIIDGKNAIQASLEFCKSLPDVQEILFFTSSAGNVPEGTRKVHRDSWTNKDLFQQMHKEAEAFDNIFYLFADSPLYDPQVVRRMYGKHRKYFIQYTFADGYPLGITPEILLPEILPELISLADDQPVNRLSVFDTVRKDINSFDLETEISPDDLRLLRISLSADTYRNYEITRGIIEKGGRDEETIIAAIRNNQDVLRSVPAYVSVQVTDGCPQSCSYCPYPGINPELLKSRNHMEPEQFGEVVAKVRKYCHDAVINLSHWGEPSFHPDFPELYRKVMDEKGLRLFIETSGIGWDPEVLKACADISRERVTWIVSIDALTQKKYQELRGTGFQEAVDTFERLSSLFPDSSYIQAVRIQENEEELVDFYRQWKKKTDNIIIQKYDNYGENLPDRKIADVSPLKRFPCWHLKRDLVVLLDGTVPMCRTDLKQEFVYGNIFRDDLNTIWENGREMYKRHILEDYPALCKKCDEYYTFNA